MSQEIVDLQEVRRQWNSISLVGGSRWLTPSG